MLGGLDVREKAAHFALKVCGLSGERVGEPFDVGRRGPGAVACAGARGLDDSL